MIPHREVVHTHNRKDFSHLLANCLTEISISITMGGGAFLFRPQRRGSVATPSPVARRARHRLAAGSSWPGCFSIECIAADSGEFFLGLWAATKKENHFTVRIFHIKRDLAMQLKVARFATACVFGFAAAVGILLAASSVQATPYYWCTAGNGTWDTAADGAYWSTGRRRRGRLAGRRL
jgi:hypothetical protein